MLEKKLLHMLFRIRKVGLIDTGNNDTCKYDKDSNNKTNNIIKIDNSIKYDDTNAKDWSFFIHVAVDMVIAIVHILT